MVRRLGVLMRKAILVVLLVAGACGKKGDDKQAAGGGGGGGGDTMAHQQEAISGVKKIYDGARSYYMDEYSDRATGEPLPRQFPVSAGPTPPLGSCCKEKGGVCAPSVRAWDDPTWLALKFSVDEPGRYSYELKSSGTGAGATFTAAAYGDLDCDGTYSTFEEIGTVGPDGELAAPALMKSSPDE